MLSHEGDNVSDVSVVQLAKSFDEPAAYPIIRLDLLKIYAIVRNGIT